MAAYLTVTSARTTVPDLPGLLLALRALAPESGVRMIDPQHYVVKRAAAWTPADITAAQTVIDTAPAGTPQLAAQAWIDAMPIGEKAFILALIDEINLLRAALPVPLPPRTPGQALAAIRAKAATL